MKQFLALFFVSALVFTASAELNSKAVTDIFTGFTKGMNFGDFNPSVDNCSHAMNKTRVYANDVVLASETENPEAFATAVSGFGLSFAQAVRSCGKSLTLVNQLLHTLQDAIKNIPQDSLMTRLFTNLLAFQMKFASLKLNLQSQNFVGVGENLAEVFKLFVLNGGDLQRRQLGQLDKVGAMVGASPKFVADIFNVLLGVQGFLEEGNTTIVVDHYTAFVNDTTDFVGQFPALQEAIINENFPQIITVITAIYKSIGVVAADYIQVKGEAVAFVQRDLPLFDNTDKVAKAVESLFLDLPTTIANVMRISSAFKYGDYRELGRGSGAVYNQLRKGAMN